MVFILMLLGKTIFLKGNQGATLEEKNKNQIIWLLYLAKLDVYKMKGSMVRLLEITRVTKPPLTSL